MVNHLKYLAQQQQYALSIQRYKLAWIHAKLFINWFKRLMVCTLVSVFLLVIYLFVWGGPQGSTNNIFNTST